MVKKFIYIKYSLLFLFCFLLKTAHAENRRQCFENMKGYSAIKLDVEKNTGIEIQNIAGIKIKNIGGNKTFYSDGKSSVRKKNQRIQNVDSKFPQQNEQKKIFVGIHVDKQVYNKVQETIQNDRKNMSWETYAWYKFGYLEKAVGYALFEDLNKAIDKIPGIVMQQVKPKIKSLDEKIENLNKNIQDAKNSLNNIQKNVEKKVEEFTEQQKKQIHDVNKAYKELSELVHLQRNKEVEKVDSLFNSFQKNHEENKNKIDELAKKIEKLKNNQKDHIIIEKNLKEELVIKEQEIRKLQEEMEKLKNGMQENSFLAKSLDITISEAIKQSQENNSTVGDLNRNFFKLKQDNQEYKKIIKLFPQFLGLISKELALKGVGFEGRIFYAIDMFTKNLEEEPKKNNNNLN